MNPYEECETVETVRLGQQPNRGLKPRRRFMLDIINVSARIAISARMRVAIDRQFEDTSGERRQWSCSAWSRPSKGVSGVATRLGGRDRQSVNYSHDQHGSA